MAVITAPANLVLNGTVGVPFSANTPNATYAPGGVYNTEYAVQIGSLPPGVNTFNPAQNTPFSNALPFLNNFLTGTPTTPGTFVFILRWFESGTPADFSDQQITINIAPPPTPPAADLKYFDHIDNPPTEINSNTPFNDEALGLWLGYDAANNQVCITNASRSVVLFCIALAPAVLDPKTLTYFDHSDTPPTKINSSTPFNDPTSDVWIGWDANLCKLCISNYNRTVLLGCADLSVPAGGLLAFFDNSNVIPANQAIGVPFNNEFGNVWMGWDNANSQLCITNYNRLSVICCFTLMDLDACPIMTLTPLVLPAGTVGVPYGPQVITINNGTAPYTFNPIALPAGLAAATDAGAGQVTISGTPTALAGSYPVTIIGTDANGCPFSQNFTLTLNDPIP